MKNTLFEGYQGPRLPREVQLRRIKQVISEELTKKQKQTLTAYYFRQLTVTQIAQEQGVNKSTVSRTLHRAETKLRRYLRY